MATTTKERPSEKAMRLADADEKAAKKAKRPRRVVVKPGTDKHPPAVRELLKRAGLSEASELTERQAENATALLAGTRESQPNTEDALRAAIKGRRDAKRRPRVKVDDVDATIAERANGLATGRPFKMPIRAAQVHTARKALGSRTVAELGINPGSTKLRGWIRDGGRGEPEFAAPIAEFKASSPALAKDSTLFGRKVAAVLVAIADES